VEGLLRGYKGVALVVSHDAAFMDSVTDELLVVDGPAAPPRRVSAKYSEYLASVRAARRAAAVAAATPGGAAGAAEAGAGGQERHNGNGAAPQNGSGTV
jgi:ATPase subunit of ABC transporter with duplicated ATPase domains